MAVKEPEYGGGGWGGLVSAALTSGRFVFTASSVGHVNIFWVFGHVGATFKESAGEALTPDPQPAVLDQGVTGDYVVNNKHLGSGAVLP